MAVHKLITTSPGRTLTWGAVRKFQETGKPHTFEQLRFRCDICHEVDSLEVAEKLVTGTGRSTIKHQVCTMCKFTRKTTRQSKAPTRKPVRVTTTVKTEEVK